MYKDPCRYVQFWKYKFMILFQQTADFFHEKTIVGLLKSTSYYKKITEQGFSLAKEKGLVFDTQ